jgi:ectoine hydroxylase-related dioxygenase (phytanoyl-CoA dioxygenase family)
VMSLSAEQVRFYEENGYLLLPGLFSEDEVATLHEGVRREFAVDEPRRTLEKDGRTVRAVHGSHAVDELFARLVRDPRLLLPARQLLGDDVYVHQFKINAKAAFSGDVWEWHQDFLFWHKEDGMPQPRATTVVVFGEEVNEFNGPLLFVPGSHRIGMVDVEGKGGVEGPAWITTLTADLKYSLPPDLLAETVKRRGMVAPKAPAGSVLIFHPDLFHGSAGNMSPFGRTLILISYNSVANHLLPVPAPRPEWLAARNFAPLEVLPEGAVLAATG